MAAVGYDVSNHPAYHSIGEDEDERVTPLLEDEDGNMSLFDLNIDSVDVTLSLWRWLDGKGLVEDAVVKGVRGILGQCSMEGYSHDIETFHQIVAPSFGTRKTLPIPCIFATNHFLVILS